MQILKGHYVQADGTLQRGKLDIERQGEAFFCPHTGDRLGTCLHQQTPELAYAAIVPECGGWTFIPDGGECERVGLPIRKA